MIGFVRALAALTLVSAVTANAVAGTGVPADDVPGAVHRDPPRDAAHPARSGGIAFASGGAQVNGRLFRPAGAGPHPAVILLHGLPGNEQNLDLARAMQRAGWAVITFHYRGSWGSGGAYTLRGGCEDAKALLALLDGQQADRWGIDRARIAVIGHSYGGYVAACVAQARPELIGAGLIAPWDGRYNADRWAGLSPEARRRETAAFFDGIQGRMAGTDAATLTAEILGNREAFDLGGFASALATRPLLVLTATRDDPEVQAIGLLSALERQRASRLVARRYDTDHGFNDRRIALQIEVLRWLATLPGAPRR